MESEHVRWDLTFKRVKAQLGDERRCRQTMQLQLCTVRHQLVVSESLVESQRQRLDDVKVDAKSLRQARLQTSRLLARVDELEGRLGVETSQRAELERQLQRSSCDRADEFARRLCDVELEQRLDVEKSLRSEVERQLAEVCDEGKRREISVADERTRLLAQLGDLRRQLNAETTRRTQLERLTSDEDRQPVESNRTDERELVMTSMTTKQRQVSNEAAPASNDETASTVRGNLDSAKRHVNHINEELDSAHPRVKQLTVELMTLRNESSSTICRLTAELMTSRSELMTSRNEADSMLRIADKVRLVEDDLRRANETISSLEEQVQCLRPASMASHDVASSADLTSSVEEGLGKKLGAALAQAAEQEHQRRDAEDRLKALEERMEEQQAQVALQRNHMKKQQVEQRKRSDEYDRMVVESQRHSSALKELLARHESDLEERHRKIARLEDELAAGRQELAAAVGRATNAEASRIDSNQCVETLTAELERLKEELTNHVSAAVPATDGDVELRVELEREQRTRVALKSQNESLESQVQSLFSQRRSLESQLIVEKRSRDTLDRDKVRAMTKELSALRSYCDVLRTRVGTLQDKETKVIKIQHQVGTIPG